MEEENEDEVSKTMKKIAKRVLKRMGKKALIIVLIVVFVLSIIAALFNHMRDKDCINSNDPDSKDYKPYGPIARNNSVYISEDGTLMPEMSVDEMWEKDKRYEKYLTEGGKDELAYLLNAQLVTQYPYIKSAKKNQLNGTVKFYRNDASEAMEYKSKEDFEKLVDQFNEGKESVLDKALNSFTINSDGTISVAYLIEESYSLVTDDKKAAQEGKVEIGAKIEGEEGNYHVYKESRALSITNISYINYVQNYVLPFNFLWALIVWGNGAHPGEGSAQDLAHAIATMAYNGEISLILDDNTVTTTDTDTYHYTRTEHYDGTLKAIIKTERETTTTSSDGTSNSSSNRESDKVETKQITDYRIDKGNYYKVYEETHTDTNPDIKIKTIESWSAVFKNDAQFDSEITSNESNPDKKKLGDSEKDELRTDNLDQAIADGVQPAKEWKDEINRKYPDSQSGGSNLNGDGTTSSTTVKHSKDFSQSALAVTENDTNINVSSVNVTINSSYANGTVTSPNFNLDIADLFNVATFHDVKREVVKLDDKYGVLKAMANNEDTANMLDLFKYVFNKILDPDYDKKEEEFKSLWGDMYQEFTEVTADGSSIVKTDVEGGLPAVTVDQYKKAAKKAFVYEKAAAKSNVTKYMNVFMKYQEENKISAFFALAVAMCESQVGADIQPKQYPADMMSVRVGREKEEDPVNSFEDSIHFFYRHVYRDYFPKGIVTIKTIGEKYCEPPEGWIETVTKWTNKLYSAAGVSISTATGGSANSADIVSNAKKIHEHLEKNNYAYSCTHNVNNGYKNNCTCDGASCFGKDLNSSTVKEFYNIRCIDCSAFVSWVLYKSGIDIGRQASGYFYNETYKSNTKYNWKKITNWNELQPGDILVKSKHVGIYIGDGKSLEAGSTNSIRSDHSYGSLAKIKEKYAFAVRVSKK